MCSMYLWGGCEELHRSAQLPSQLSDLHMLTHSPLTTPPPTLSLSLSRSMPRMMMMEPGMKGSVSFANWFGRCCGGERCCMDEYVNDEPERPQMLGLTPNVPAKVIPLQMRQGDLVRCKKGAFFASTGTVEIGYKYDCNPARCCCSGQGCVQQTVSGEGVGFLSAMGTIMTKKLAEGEVLVVDTNSLVAWDDTAELGIRRVGGCCTCCCGGEGMFNSTVTGPGTVYFQSMSFERFKASLAVQVTRQAAVGGAAGGVVGGLVSSA
ncbi:tryptophan RNA-binding attenuator protein-like domain-containing protein [Pavlovales sp. CCMP2436]|nr:tryptophan RNA-binding attenuator protein-like domain-containing protein [Pavlovales sp. CCMP2436]